MTGFPDLHVTMHDLSIGDKAAIYRWTLTGTNTGPGGARRKVRIGGFERWRLGMDDRIAESQGHFDHADYQRQLHGIFSATTSQD